MTLPVLIAAAIGPIDGAIVVVYVVASTLLGIWLGRGLADQRDYFLGGRQLPTWALLLSIVATETSTVTFLSVPGLSFVEGGDFRFLQIAIGYVLGRLAIVAWLLPHYFRGEMLTAYQVLEHSFGLATRRLASLVFLVTRSIADGLRLFLTALALHVAVGIDVQWCIVLLSVAIGIYSCFGGVRSIVWNDCLQFTMYMVGAAVAAVLLVWRLPGGWGQLMEFAESTGRMRLFDFDPSLTKPGVTFWSGIIGGAFLSLASHGTDQMIVQRYLCAKDRGAASWALGLSGFVVFFQFALFLFIGLELACYYSLDGRSQSIGSGDEAFMTFIVRDLETGLSGLLLAAAFAAAISSSLNSLASSLMSDWMGPRLASWGNRRTLILARWLTIFFAVIQGAVAIGIEQLAIEQAVVDTVLKIAGFATGLILGLYGLALIAPRTSQAVALGAFFTGVAVMFGVAFGTQLNGYWYALVGSGTIVLVGMAMSQFGSIFPARAAVILLAITLLPAGPALADAVGPALEQRIDAAVGRYLHRGEMAGCVVVIGRRDGILFEKAYGNRQIEPEKVPMTIDTVFDMASLTKPIATGTSVMLLVERGELRLSDKVAEYFPEFKAHGKGDVTIEQLLVHSGGLIPDNSLKDYDDGWESAKPKICDLKPLAPPGKEFEYSDVGFILLGKIVEQVAGKPANEFVKEEVFAKLGMDETGYLPPDDLKARAATTEKRDGKWLTGVVHDPRAAKMGGVAGHAGLFSTAQDLVRFAQTMLRGGELDGVRILGAATVAEMTRPRTIGINERGLGWDMGSVYSRNRGETMSPRAFGHGGFTGTAMWIDPELDLYVIFLSTRLHPDGVGEVNSLAGRVGTIAAGAISPANSSALTGRLSDQSVGDVKLGIDVLEAGGFAPLRGKRVGLITNHTGLNSDGISTAKLLYEAEKVKLVALFSPEHGIAGALDVNHIGDSRDEELDVPIYSLYGKSRKPSSRQLAGIDVLVFDIQDIGARFYTYIATMGEAMEAAAEAGIEFIVLDRPNPIDGVSIEGPTRDKDAESFVAYHALPVRHGMTVGELARMFAAERKLDVSLTVIPVEGWRRTDYLHNTGLEWINPSPNMRSETAAVLYPGIGLLETTNVSVGRGTDSPFEVMGAPWIDEVRLAERVNHANPPGVRVVPIRFTPNSSKFAGEPCGGLNFVITDWDAFRPFELGLIVAHELRSVYPNEWDAKPYLRLLANDEVHRRLLAGDELQSILNSVDEQVKVFRARREPYLLYR